MSDDWRLRVELGDEDTARSLSSRLEASELEHDLEAAFQDRVVVSVDAGELFCYAGTREQAERAERLIRSLAAQQGWQATMSLQRWHPTAEAWEDPDEPLPRSDTEEAAEHAELIERERREAQAHGYPEYEVRVECRTHHDCAQLADRLRGEGLPTVRRWNYLTIGAVDEDSAGALAERIRQEAPEGTLVTSQGNLQAVYEERPPNPFAIFGGMGG